MSGDDPRGPRRGPAKALWNADPEGGWPTLDEEEEKDADTSA